VSGEAVLIGHDYASSIPEGAAQARVLENAIFASGSSSVRVLAFTQFAAPQAISSVTAILNGYASATNRHVSIVATSSASEIPSWLDVASFEAVLVFDQPNAPAGVLAAMGASLAPSLDAFVQGGGAVVVLDGATAPDMPLFVTNAGLLLVTSQTPLPPGSEVVNLAPGDSVGYGVETPYLPAEHSAYFGLGLQAPGITEVIVDELGAPVVVQRTF
jgi:hypothetical protein